MTNVNKVISKEELKQVQVQLLDYFDSFCRQNNIKYSLACGTLLGAIRHKGFIPWDDDIDVYLLRKDYNQFINLAKTVKSDNYEFLSLNSDQNYTLPYCKLSCKKTVLLEIGTNLMKMGVNIDIFPLDAIPNNIVLFKLQNKCISFLKNILDIKILKISNGRAWYKNIIHFLGKVCFIWIPSRTISKIINYTCQLNDIVYCDNLFDLNDTLGYLKSFSKNVFDKTMPILFEGKYYQAMIGYDEYLTACFGDYMTPPPVDKRMSTHIMKAYWKV